MIAMNVVRSLTLLVLVIALVPETSSTTNFETIGRALDRPFETIGRAKDTVIRNVIKGKLALAGALHHNVLKPVINGKKRVLNAIITGKKSVVKAIYNGKKSAANFVINGKKSVAKAVINGKKSVAKAVINGTKSAAKAVINGKKSVAKGLHRYILRPIAQVKRLKLSGISDVLNTKTDILTRYIDRHA